MAFQYTAPDAQGQTQILTPWVAFTTYNPEVHHSPAALSVYSDADLARFGITKTVVPDPPAPRRELPKSTIHARVDAIGKLAACFAIIQSNPTLFGKWFAPDWPNVYVDDAGLLQVLAAAGLTPAEISQVTA